MKKIFAMVTTSDNRFRRSLWWSCVFPPLLSALVLTGTGGRLLMGGEQSAGERGASENPSSAVPEAVTDLDFSALKTNSPFLRSLDLSESLTLTGIARIEEDLFATLFDRETKQTHIVSRAANPQGWRMVAVAGDQTDLGTLTAKISVEGGEVFSVRFDENQLKPGEARPGGVPGGSPASGTGPSSPATNYREGVSGDGFRGPPPPELVEKLSRLSDEQRERVIHEIREIRDRNQLGSEERQRLFTRMVDRALQERR